ncbi:MAG: alpha/beta hydrolase [Chitinophagales bacterium]|nr:alpha/beta hydrolase [Hyphomicrobiales bacterium]
MTRAQLDAAYNNRAAVAGSGAVLDDWRRKSAAIRATPHALLDQRYGKAPRECFDYFPCAKADAPLFIFIHGGYWMSNDKDMFAFIAPGPQAAGFHIATIGYTLAPEAKLTQIVAEANAALSYLETRPLGMTFDPTRIVVGGWSAGGHLAAMTLDHPAVRGVLAISGVFDLEPISECYVNDTLRLSNEEIEALSPMKRINGGGAQISVVYGGAELPQLQRQSVQFAEICSKQGMLKQALSLPGHNHFSILDEFREPQGALVAALSDLIA